MDLRILVFLLILILGSWGGWAEPLFLDENGNPKSFLRTVCGNNDMVPISNQSDLIKQMARPVGLLQGPGFLCTGTLVGKDLFLTARHCEDVCGSLSVKFNFLRTEEIFNCKEIIEKGGGDNNSDYLLLRLEGTPGVEWGWYDLSDTPVLADQPLMMIHHPGGLPMKLSLKNCKFMAESDGMITHSCDTNPGSSGSAIIIPNFENPEKSRIVGIHTLGGCNESQTTFNAGPSIHHISGISSLVHSLVK